MKATIDIPKGYLEYWRFQAERRGESLGAILADKLKEITLSEIDLYQPIELASLFGLEKDYEKEYDP